MVNPEHVAIIEEAQRLRGWILNGYAQIEHFLGDVIVRSLSLPEYAALADALSHRVSKRVRDVRRVLQIEGIFSEFAAEIEDVLAGFELHHETRNLLAHGFCSFHFTVAGDCGLEFRKWHRVPDRKDAQLIRTFRIADLLNEKEKINQLAQKSVILFAKTHERLGLVGK